MERFLKHWEAREDQGLQPFMFSSVQIRGRQKGLTAASYPDITPNTDVRTDAMDNAVEMTVDVGHVEAMHTNDKECPGATTGESALTVEGRVTVRPRAKPARKRTAVEAESPMTTALTDSVIAALGDGSRPQDDDSRPRTRLTRFALATPAPSSPMMSPKDLPTPSDDDGTPCQPRRKATNRRQLLTPSDGAETDVEDEVEGNSIATDATPTTRRGRLLKTRRRDDEIVPITQRASVRQNKT